LDSIDCTIETDHRGLSKKNVVLSEVLFMAELQRVASNHKSWC